MKKTLLILGSFLALNTLLAQPKLGIKFSPAINYNRTFIISDTVDFNTKPARFRFGLGLLVDQGLTETYFLSSGIFFVPRRVTINIEPENGGTYKNTREEYDLQYLQVPVTLKLHTSELLSNLGLFFQVGGAFDINIFSQPRADEYTLITKFAPLDISVILASGVEYNAGVNTVLFGGLSFQRGLVNLAKATQPELSSDFYIRSTMLSLDFGIKF